MKAYDMFLLLAIFKISSLFIGFAITYMGYRLFLSGLWGHAGDLEAQFKDNRLLVKKAAPGSFFAILGAVIVVVSIAKGFDINLKVEDAPSFETERPKLP